MSAVRIVADRDVCIGAGLCVTTAPAVFDQDDGGIVELVGEPGDDTVAAVEEAVRLCPSGALRTTG